jgi:hypothetical protein
LVEFKQIRVSEVLLRLRQEANQELRKASWKFSFFRFASKVKKNGDKIIPVTILLGKNDEEFVQEAYRHLLHRQPDLDGLSSYLDCLRSDRLTKLELLSEIVSSPEGQKCRVYIRGLDWRMRLLKLPIFGSLVRRLFIRW